MGSCQSQPDIIVNDGLYVRSRHAIVIGNRMLVPLGSEHTTKEFIEIDLKNRGKLKLIKRKKKVNFQDPDSDESVINNAATP